MFYQLLEWINSSESIFESSDCRLEEPKKTPHKNIAYEMILQGRLMVFFRDMKLNYADLDPKNPKKYWVNPQMTRLALETTEYLKNIYQDIRQVAIQLFFFPTNYRQETDSSILGQQLVFQFNCFGNKEEELFYGFKFFITGVLEALKQADKYWRTAIT